jgi:hypothetical protein
VFISYFFDAGGRLNCKTVAVELNVNSVRQCPGGASHMARARRLDELPYLTDVLRKLPAVVPGDTAGINMFLPDHWIVYHPGHRLLECERESHDAQRRRRIRRAASNQ